MAIIQVLLIKGLLSVLKGMVIWGYDLDQNKEVISVWKECLLNVCNGSNILQNNV